MYLSLKLALFWSPYYFFSSEICAPFSIISICLMEFLNCFQSLVFGLCFLSASMIFFLLSSASIIFRLLHVSSTMLIWPFLIHVLAILIFIFQICLSAYSNTSAWYQLFPSPCSTQDSNSFLPALLPSTRQLKPISSY